MNNTLEMLNPDTSGKITIDGEEWRNVTNFFIHLSSIVPTPWSRLNFVP